MKEFRVWGLATSRIVAVFFVLLIFLYPACVAGVCLPYTLYPVNAQVPDIGYSRITPASPVYFLKGVRESLELRFAGTPRVKMIRKLEFATRRLREAKTLILQDAQLIQPTLERYMAELNSLPREHQENSELGLMIKEVLTAHLPVLEQMYSQTSNSKAKIAIRSVMNRIIQRADVSSSAREPVCKLFSKEASSIALNEVEKMVLAERARKCEEFSGKIK